MPIDYTPCDNLASGSCAVCPVSAKNGAQGVLMRNSFSRSDSAGWGVRIAIGIAVVFVLGVVGLALYGGSLKPPHQTYEQVLPDDRFPH